MRRKFQIARKLSLVLVAGSLALAASACNTVKGAGEDLKSASQSTEDAINGR
ncbi:MAG: entericidin A/B family lipoprotein [Novosphingobium sp.]|jgi:entericidin B